MSEKDNHRRWADDKRGVYEVWYATWNHIVTGQGFWLRYITEAPVDPSRPSRGELWFARFDPHDGKRTFGIHKRFDRVDSATDPFSLAIGGAKLGHDHAIGGVEGGGHEVEWNLRWDAAKDSLHLLPDLAYVRGGIGESTVLSPNPRVAMTGTLVVDGETLTFERAVFGQSHVWGKKHSYNWAWGRCAELTGAPDALIEVYLGKLERRGVVLPPVSLVVLWLDGKRHELNQFRHLAANRGKWGDHRMAFTAWSPALKIEGEMSAPADSFVLAPYEDPDGTDVFCANTEIGDARITVYERAGFAWREYRRLEAHGRAHFELGSRTRDPSVVREHVLV